MSLNGDAEFGPGAAAREAVRERFKEGQSHRPGKGTVRLLQHPQHFLRCVTGSGADQFDQVAPHINHRSVIRLAERVEQKQPGQQEAWVGRLEGGQDRHPGPG